MHQNLLSMQETYFQKAQFPAFPTSFGAESSACSSNSAILSDWCQFFPQRTSHCKLEFSSARKDCINTHVRQVLTPRKVESCVSVGTLSLGYCSYSLTQTLSYCNLAFDFKIRIYLFPNLSFTALFYVDYSSYDSQFGTPEYFIL